MKNLWAESGRKNTPALFANGTVPVTKVSNLDNTELKIVLTHYLRASDMLVACF
jgi:hypothetical protein